MAGRKPDYRLAALDKETDDTDRVGAAWKNDNGSISIRLNTFVHLIGNKNLVLTLFPEGERPQGSKDGWWDKNKDSKEEGPPF